jgi:hypothetical protein
MPFPFSREILSLTLHGDEGKKFFRTAAEMHYHVGLGKENA